MWRACISGATHNRPTLQITASSCWRALAATLLEPPSSQHAVAAHTQSQSSASTSAHASTHAPSSLTQPLQSSHYSTSSRDSSTPSCSYHTPLPTPHRSRQSLIRQGLQQQPNSLTHVQQTRGQQMLRRVFPLPPAIQEVIDAKVTQTEDRKHAADPPHVPQPTTPLPLQPSSRRVGCIAYKAGMTHEWDAHGVRVPLTVLWLDECQVVGMKWEEQHGYNALVLGAGHSKQKALHPAVAGYYIKHELPFKRKAVEFPVSEDARLPMGHEITSAHYVPGQSVDVVGWTKWKGFQGVMKKWNFKGMPATHGNTLSHRHGGAIGGRTDPGKVWKGKKMPGNMGDERRTVHDCLVYKVDTARNLVYVRGQVPGPAGRMVLLRDAYNVKHDVRSSWGLPFPTSIPAALSASSEAADSSNVQTYQPKGLDPYRAYSDDSDYFGVRWKKTD